MYGKKSELETRNGTKGTKKSPQKIMLRIRDLFMKIILPPWALVKKPCSTTINPMTALKKGLHALLRRSEGLFKVDMIYVTKGGFWTSLRFGAGIIASLITMVAFGNLVPKETYGTYSYMLSLAGTFGFLTLSGMGSAVVRSVARGYESIMPYALRTQLRYNLLAIAGIGSAGIYYGIRGNSVFALSLGILAIAIPISAAYHIFESYLMGKKRFDTLAKITSVTSIVAALTTALTLFFTNNVVILVAVYSATSLVPSIISYYYVQTGIPKQKEIDPINLSELKRTSFHLTGAGLISAVAQYIDKIILFQVAGPVSLAIYGFATAGPERLKGLAKNWMSIILPRLAERSLEDIRKVFYQRLIISLALGIILSSLYIVAAPTLFNLFLPKYTSSIFYSQISSLSVVAVPMGVFIGYIFYGQNMLRAIYINSTITQVIRIALFVVLGWQWQTWGLIIASIAVSITSTLSSIMVWEMESRRLLKKNG